MARTPEAIVAVQIGNITMQIATLVSENETLKERCFSSYQLLASCIRSDQLSAQQVHEVMKNKDFAEWYKESFPINLVTSNAK